MAYNLPFPKGHNPTLDRGVKIELLGVFDKAMKNKTATLKISETDILEIRQLLVEEIKHQNEN